MHMRPVYQWSARVKDAVIMRISSYALPRRVTHFSDCTALVCRSWPTAWPRCAAAGLLKTRNQFNLSSIAYSDLGCWVYEKAKPSTPRSEH